MPRTAILIIVVLLIVGALVGLSLMAKEQPRKTIEVDVPQGGNAH